MMLGVRESSSLHQEWTDLQQLHTKQQKQVNLGKPNRKHQDGYNPDNQKLRQLLNKRDKLIKKYWLSEVPEQLLQLTAGPPDNFNRKPVLTSRPGGTEKQKSYRELRTDIT